MTHEIHKTNVDRGAVDGNADAGNGSASTYCFHFHFVVGDRVVPAGKCVLQAANAAADTILIRNDDKMVRLFSSTSLGDARNVPASNQLVFHKYGERYFLAAVRVQGTRIMYWLPESKQETRLRQQDQSSAEETIHAF